MPVILAAVLAVTAILGSCSEKQESSNAQEESASESSAAPSVTTKAPIDSDPAADDDSDKYRMDSKLTYLSCIENEYRIPELSSIGDGKLLATDWQYEDDITSMQVIDILEDKIIAEASVSGYATFESVTDSGFILENIDSKEFCFFDNDLNLLKTYRPESMYGKFSPDGKKYYQIICGKLYCEDVGSGELTHIQTSADLDFEETVSSISSDGDRLGLRYDKYTDIYIDTAEIRVDLRSNTVDMLTYEISYPAYSDDYMYTHIVSDDDSDAMLYRISLDDSECIAFPLSQYDIMNIAGCDYLQITEMSEINYPKMYIGYVDNSGKCNMLLLNEEDPEEYFSWFTYMPNEQLIACCTETNGRVRICLIEPSLFDISTDLEYEQVPAPVLYDEQIYEEYLISSKIPECPARLETLRKRADALEDMYGIKIYISSECKNMVRQKGYDCTDEFFDSGYEFTAIETALDEMEAALQKYPDGFLAQFRCSTGDGGIRICLTSYIHDDFSAAYSIQTGDWYNIVLDIRYNSEINLAHELWHSTESYIDNKNYELLSTDVWMTYNPEGFEYSDEFKEDSGGMSDYCYIYSNDWYFYDNYSKVNPLEDKARIMEIVMNPQLFSSEDFVSSKHIMEKLECMNNAVRQTFDTSSWGDDVFWERFSS